MKITKTICVLILLAAAQWALAEDSTSDRTVVPFSDPGKPGLIKIDLINGGVTIKGYEGKEVIIDAKTRSQKLNDKENNKHAGMRKLQIQGTSGLDVQEKNNVMEIETESWKSSVDLTVQVPFNTSLKISCVNGGDINVENVASDIETANVNGSIKLTRISGSAVAETTNGNVIVSFTKINSAKAMSFVTLNGDVDLTLPNDAKANLKMKFGNSGNIYCDFEMTGKSMPEKTVEDKRKEGGHYKVSIEHSIVGSINGGGQTIKLETFNGDIMLRKAK